MKLYVAGGAVRDLLLGGYPKDIDYAFDATEEEFIQRNPSARKLQSGNYPIYLLDESEYSRLAEGSPEKDLARRDFTLNAFLLEENGVLHSLPDSLTHLRDGVLHPATEHSLRDDPLRVFRGARLCAVLEQCAPSEECLRQMAEIGEAGLLAGLSPERVGAEAMKACFADRPGNFLRVLNAAGCLAPWFAPLDRAVDVVAGPPAYHNGSVLEHTAEVMDGVAAFAKERGFTAPRCAARGTAVWMALCHDLGKVDTAPDILPHHYAHEEKGKPLAAALGERLRLSARMIQAGETAAFLHMKGGIYASLRAGKKVDLLTTLHARNFMEPFFILAAVDGKMPALPDLAAEDLRKILAVRLPVGKRNMGAASGVFLRQLRCGVLQR